MVRTINPATHTVRRDAFIDAAQRLIATKGYEEMSVQDLLDVLDASRGAFYHYFESKGALLEAVIDRTVDGALAAVTPQLADASRSAPQKIVGVLSGIGAWKTQRKDLMVGLLRVWMSDDNAIVREKFRREVTRRLTPLIAQVAAQGIDEGDFTASSPAPTARVFISLLLAANEAATQLYLDRQANRVTYEEVEQILSAFGEGFARILGAAPGTLPLVEPGVLHEWFD